MDNIRRLRDIEKWDKPRLLVMLIRYFQRPARFDYLHKWLSVRGIKVLDIGCGNHSPFLMKKIYPACIYYGVDLTRHYNLDSEDFDCMEEFFELDISNIDALSVIQNNFFDCIILSHIIEHVKNSEEVILCLLNKLKKGGYTSNFRLLTACICHICVAH